MSVAQATRPPKAPAGLTHAELNALRADFPMMSAQTNGRPLVYLDSAVTAQKPQVMIDAATRFYEREYASVHRGVYSLSQHATDLFEQARAKVADTLGAGKDETIFVRGTTEAINLAAQSYGRSVLKAGDEILLTQMEHHSNIVPWQLVAEQTGARVIAAPITDDGEIDLDSFERLLTGRTRIVAFTHVSNVLGTVNPVRQMTRMAHRRGAVVLVDGAQAIQHLNVDVKELECDFYAVSAHKHFGPTGIGALYARRSILDAMPPYHGGGAMIRSVDFGGSTYLDGPARFEAGTPHIAGAIGWAASIDYLETLDRQRIAAHEADLLGYARDRLSEVENLRVLGNPSERVGAVSFFMSNAHPHDVGTVLDQRGIAVRAGHHCCQPLMKRFGLPATVRASVALYNMRDEIDALIDGLHEVNEVFG